MKSTGIVRPIDPLGRIVLPKELRDTLDIKEKDGVEIYVEGSSIILQKHEPGCIFCGEVKGVIEHKDKRVCRACCRQINGESKKE
jgi:transcriptional pleiotropic regulator of transition state genes